MRVALDIFSAVDRCVICADVIATDKEDEAFKDLDVAVLVGSMPRREGMERKDLLKANVKIFKSQGAALDKYAKKSVKVILSKEKSFYLQAYNS